MLYKPESTCLLGINGFNGRKKEEGEGEGGEEESVLKKAELLAQVCGERRRWSGDKRERNCDYCCWREKKKKSLAGFFFLSFPAKATAFVVCDQNLKEKKREREREMHRPRPVTPFLQKKVSRLQTTYSGGMSVEEKKF